MNTSPYTTAENVAVQDAIWRYFFAPTQAACCERNVLPIDLKAATFAHLNRALQEAFNAGYRHGLERAQKALRDLTADQP